MCIFLQQAEHDDWARRVGAGPPLVLWNFLSGSQYPGEHERQSEDIIQLSTLSTGINHKNDASSEQRETVDIFHSIIPWKHMDRLGRSYFILSQCFKSFCLFVEDGGINPFPSLSGAPPSVLPWVIRTGPGPGILCVSVDPLGSWGVLEKGLMA